SFFFSSRRRHTISKRDWSSDVCSSDLATTCSGVPLNFARNSGRWVAIPVGQVFKWHWRAMAQPIATRAAVPKPYASAPSRAAIRSEEHTSELQSRFDLVCRLLLEKKKS